MHQVPRRGDCERRHIYADPRALLIEPEEFPQHFTRHWAGLLRETLSARPHYGLVEWETWRMAFGKLQQAAATARWLPSTSGRRLGSRCVLAGDGFSGAAVQWSGSEVRDHPLRKLVQDRSSAPEAVMLKGSR